MVRIEVGLMPCSEVELRAALGRYKEALEQHRGTIGVPAPWPEYECLREITASGGDFEVVKPPELTARERAFKALQEKRIQEARHAENVLLAYEALKPDAPQEVKEYVAAHPEIAALAPPPSIPVVDTSKL